MARISYTDRDVAFIFSYVDYCIEHGIDYLKTITGELVSVSKGERHVSTSAVLSQMRRQLIKFGIQPPSTSTYLRHGTTMLIEANLPEGVKDTIEEQLSEWGIGPFGTAAVANGAADATAAEVAPFPGQDGAGNEAVQVVNEDSEQNSLPTSVAPATIVESNDSFHTRSVEETPESVAPQARPTAIRGPETSDVEDEVRPVVTFPSNTAAATAAAQSQAPEDAIAPAVPASTARDTHQQPTVPPTESQSPSVQLLNRMSQANGKRKSIDDPSQGFSNKKTKLMHSASASTPQNAQRQPTVQQREWRSPSVSLSGNRTRPAEKRKTTDDFQQKPRSKRLRLTQLEPTDDVMITQSQIGALFDMNRALFDNFRNTGHGLSGETIDKLQHIHNQIHHVPGKAIERMTHDLATERAEKIKWRDLGKSIVGEYNSVNDGNKFPKTPQLFEVREGWRDLYKVILFNVGHDNDTPVPNPTSAGYLTARIEDIANGRISDAELDDCIAHLSKHLSSPHAVQILLSALLCRWIFQSPEPMLEGQHTMGWMKWLEALADTNGLAVVQHEDKVAMKRLFADPDFQHVTVERRKRNLIHNWTKIVEKIVPPRADGAPKPINPERWTTQAVQLKQNLMLSALDYRIHYIEPGTPFDPTWMEAVNARNLAISDKQAAGKEVALCLFPAFESLQARPLGEESMVGDALVKNKRFFPTFKETMAFVPDDRMTKATVLLL